VRVGKESVVRETRAKKVRAAVPLGVGLAVSSFVAAAIFLLVVFGSQ
jgi:hypothetical protein